MVDHFEAKNSNLDKHEKEMRNGVSSRLLQSEEENCKSDQEEMTSLPTARPSSPNMWKRRRLKRKLNKKILVLYFNDTKIVCLFCSCRYL